MYQSPDDARSDLFLAGAVYFFGPVVLRILLGIFPLGRVPLLAPILAVALPLVVTVLVPYLLIRYRRERLSDYGLGGGPSPALGFGALLGVPVAIVTLVAALARGQGLLDAFPVVALGPGALVDVLARFAQWIGITLLAVYATVKARDAFRGEYRTLPEGVWEVGRILGIVVVVTAGLLALALTLQAGPFLEILLLPLGVGASFWLLRRNLPARSSTRRPVLVAPTVVFAVGPFFLVFDAFAFVTGVYQAALYAVFGLAVGAMQESRRSAQAAIGLAIVLAGFTGLGDPTRLR